VSGTIDPEDLKEMFMECIAPGAIRDEELLAYLAGEKVRPFVIQHLTTCRHCADQLASYKRLEATLTARLYRWDCPPGLVLGEFQLGLLNKEMAAAVSHHLSRCPRCAGEVASLAGFLASDPLLTPDAAMPELAPEAGNLHTLAGAKRAVERVREQAREQVRRVIASLVPQQPRFAYQRGTDYATAAWPRRYRAEDITISLQVERDTKKRDMAQLIGFVTRSGFALETLHGTEVFLLPQSGADTLPVAPLRQAIDELGNFIFPSVTTGIYTLELRLPEQIVAIEQVPVTLQNS
jgi:hypothetical protein